MPEYTRTAYEKSTGLLVLPDEEHGGYTVFSTVTKEQFHVHGSECSCAAIGACFHRAAVRAFEAAEAGKAATQQRRSETPDQYRARILAAWARPEVIRA